MADGRIREQTLDLVYRGGVGIGVFVMASGAVIAFAHALARALATGYRLFVPSLRPFDGVFHALGIEAGPLPLMLVGVIESTLLAVIMLTFAFGLRAVFLGRCYEVECFDIRSIEELKSYLVGLIVTLVGTQFLEFVLVGGSGRELMLHAFGVSAVIVALGGFSLVLWVLRGKQRPREVEGGTCEL